MSHVLTLLIKTSTSSMVASASCSLGELGELGVESTKLDTGDTPSGSKSSSSTKVGAPDASGGGIGGFFPEALLLTRRLLSALARRWGRDLSWGSMSRRVGWSAGGGVRGEVGGGVRGSVGTGGSVEGRRCQREEKRKLDMDCRVDEGGGEGVWGR